MQGIFCVPLSTMLYSFVCCWPGEPSYIFTVPIDPNYLVSDLTKMIWQKLRDREQYVPLNEVRLYKMNVPTNLDDNFLDCARQFLREHSTDMPLDQGAIIGKVFPEGPHEGVRLDIIFTIPEELGLHQTINNSEASYGKKIRNDLDKKVGGLPCKLSPSDTVRNMSNTKSLLNTGKVFRNQVPVALFSVALAKLQHRLEKNDAAVSHDEVTLASTFITLAQARLIYNDNEWGLGNSIKEAINSALKSECYSNETLGWDGDIRPAGCWLADGFISIVLELKDVPGIGGDPILQSIADLCSIIACPKYNDYRGCCNFPVVLIGAAGSHLQISIAVYLGAIFVSDLVVIDLSCGFHGSDTTVRLARIFQALALCREELGENYTGLRPSSRYDFSFLYPHPVTANETPLPTIKYDKYLAYNGLPIETVPDLGKRSTALYTGTLDGGERVLIKFAARYNVEAHKLLAEAGLAPWLHFSNPVIGNVHMIVMDYLPEATWDLKPQVGRAFGLPPSAILDKVEHAVSLLHERDIVFGNLDEGNIVRFDDRVMLLDFDWAGRHGVDHYPATLNMKGDWADGVRPYGLMYKEHDMWQLARLRKLYKS